jgi:hypothetical protein
MKSQCVCIDKLNGNAVTQSYKFIVKQYFIYNMLHVSALKGLSSGFIKISTNYEKEYNNVLL